MNPIGIVFDVDGVLVDTSRSFPEVVSSAVSFCASSIPSLKSVPLIFTKEHYIKTKSNPMFNDDYDIAWTFLSWAASNTSSISPERWANPDEWEAAIKKCHLDPVLWVPKTFRSDVDRNEVRKICEELYFGEEIIASDKRSYPRYLQMSGLWKNERPCLEAGWRNFGKPIGIYTGRSRQELQLALELLKWEDFPRDHCITADDSIKKPSPEGLSRLEKILGVSEIFFFGDSESDRKAFEGYGKGRFFPIGEAFPSTMGPFATLKEALVGAGLEV